ncbi:OmpA family protein [Sedimenticola sp.]|uniref:OmpA family protein n=1 Tax=Sedimenticola sp. TaxID=1940285 RepID=UPI00258A326D|nr:OmpA family protein [Sedimenticola sp.]MCW8903807.1 OmpA family protein [Sedimenticola sp.]
MKTSLYARTLFAMASLALVNATFADQNTKEGYTLGTPDKSIVMNGSNNCWRTGFWTADMAIAECDPSLVKVAAAETPMAPVAPPPMKSEAIVLTLESDTLFEFDKSVISAEGKQQLDNQVIAKMNEYPQIEMVRITGHADRIGSEAYNQKLSQRRADAVKDYLIEQGIVSSRTETAGSGESDPAVSCADITGRNNSQNTNLVDCLKPNRRVVVEIKTLSIAQQ